MPVSAGRAVMRGAVVVTAAVWVVSTWSRKYHVPAVGSGSVAVQLPRELVESGGDCRPR